MYLNFRAKNVLTTRKHLQEEYVSFQEEWNQEYDKPEDMKKNHREFLILVAVCFLKLV